MFALQVLRRSTESCEIQPVDDILRRQFCKADRKRPTVPVEMYGATATGIEPLVQCALQCRPIALAELRQPDKNIGIIKQSSKGTQLLIRRRRGLLGENHPGNMRARSTNDFLERRNDSVE